MRAIIPLLLARIGGKGVSLDVVPSVLSGGTTGMCYLRGGNRVTIKGSTSFAMVSLGRRKGFGVSRFRAGTRCSPFSN